MTKIRTIESVTELQGDLANRYKTVQSSTEQFSVALHAEIAADFETLKQDGYVIIRNLLDASQLEELRSATLPLLGQSGRNNFEGVKTQRLYNVLEKTRALDSLATHPRVTGLLDRLFQPNYLLSQAQIINILEGEAAQPLHYDDGFYLIPRPRNALGAATVWALDDFTEDNGATVVIPKSHCFGEELITEQSPAMSTAIPAVMPAGSVVFFLGTLWHGGGANTSQASRLAATCQYCEPWLRPQENFFLELSHETLADIPEQLLSMVGYSVHPPFMGMVNGMHPKRTLPQR